MSYSLLPLKREAAHSLSHRFSLFSYLIGYQKNVISYTINEITFHSCRQTHRKPCLLTLKSRLYWSTNFVLLVLPLYENFKLFGDYCQYNSRYLRAFPCFYQFSQTCFVKIAHPSPKLPDRMLQIILAAYRNRVGCTCSIGRWLPNASSCNHEMRLTAYRRKNRR